MASGVEEVDGVTAEELGLDGVVAGEVVTDGENNSFTAFCSFLAGMILKQPGMSDSKFVSFKSSIEDTPMKVRLVHGYQLVQPFV